jgi:hypothetical protein
MANTKKIKEGPSTYLLKKGDKFYMIPSQVVESLSIDEAFKLGLAAQVELRRQLLQDALGGDHYIEDVKVVDGLEASLKKLGEMFPGVRKNILKCDMQYHTRIGRS